MKRATMWTSLILGLAAFAVSLNFAGSTHAIAQSAVSTGVWQLNISANGLFAWKLNTATGDLFFCVAVAGQPPRCLRSTNPN